MATSMRRNEDEDMENFEPPPTKKKKKDRFRPPISEDELAEISKGFVPPNTKKNSDWGMRVFLEWRAQRNERVDDTKCPNDLLDRPAEPEVINQWLAKFVAEVRKMDGQPYPPKTIHQILAALQRTMLEKHPDAPRFMEKNNTAFRSLHRACDTVYRDLHSQGIGAVVRHTEIFTADEEERLWSTGVLGTDTPTKLQRAVFFTIGKRFCVRGGEEQRNLGPSQFRRDHNCYVYTEHGSKNRSGGLAQLNVENKCVPCYPVPESGERCAVFLLDKYPNKLPSYAFEKNVFYCRPKQFTPHDDKTPWFDCIPVGKNKLSSMVKDICKEAGVSQKTNHSLRATGATCLFQNHVPERIIQKTTGHRSLESLRTYEKISAEQYQSVSRAMLTNANTDSSVEKEAQTTSRVTTCQATTSQATTSQAEQIFRDITNCKIGSLTVNINPTIVHKSAEDEFDAIACSLDLDFQ